MRVTVDYPMKRLLSEEEAIDYCFPKGMRGRRSMFLSLCPVRPVVLGDVAGAPLAYDVRDLDAWIDGRKGVSVQTDEEVLARLQ
jgi:hypothetical protein